MKNTKAKNKTSFSTVRKYNSNKESFCMFINTSQLWASASNEIPYAYSALKDVLKTGGRKHGQRKVSSVFTFSSYLNRRKMQIKCLALLLFYKNFDSFPKLFFSYKVLNTHMYMDSTTCFFHSTSCISWEFMQ